MGFPRVKADGQRVYYCASRVVEGRFIFQTSVSWFGEAKRFIKQTQNGCLRALARRRCLHAIFALGSRNLAFKVPQVFPGLILLPQEHISLNEATIAINARDSVHFLFRERIGGNGAKIT